MKKLMSAVLAGLMLASTVACGTAEPTERNYAKAASASAEEYAQFLDDRLGADAAGITVGTEEDAGRYGVELDSLRDEGYVIRKENGSALIFGKTDGGLDRGVRYYANHFADTDSVNYTYGEGARIKSLTIDGCDIANYSIVIPSDADQCHEYAASELQRYIKQACGAELTVADTADGRAIRLEPVQTDDPRYAALGDEGFTISVEKNGDLVITGGYLRGCLFGVYELLEKYVGYRFLYDFNNYVSGQPCSGEVDYVFESDHVNIPAGISDTQTPSFGMRTVYRWANNTPINTSTISDYVVRNKTLPIDIANIPKYNSYGLVSVACHGVTNYLRYAGTYSEYTDSNGAQTKQPCYTDEEFIESAIDYYLNIVEAKKDGLGKTMTCVDVSQLDNANFCMCSNCIELMQMDGGNVGPVLNFTNQIADAIDEKYNIADKDPYVWVCMLAYWGTASVPLVTKPSRNVNISYCYYNDLSKLVCYAHDASGRGCADYDVRIDSVRLSNKKYAEELEGWCKISEMVTIWYYPGNWEWHAFQSPVLDTIRADMKYFASLDKVHGFFVDAGGYNIIDEWIIQYVISQLWWDADMSDEEFDALIEDYFYVLCGDGYSSILDYMEIQKLAKKDGCWSIMAWTDPSVRIDFDVMANHFEESAALFRTAELLAGTSDQERFVRMLSCSMYMTGLTSVHTDWYENGDDESRAKYEKYFAEFAEVAKETNFSISYASLGGGTPNIVPEEFFEDPSKNPGEWYTELGLFNQSPGGAEDWWK